jgi:hypothetical protein
VTDAPPQDASRVVAIHSTTIDSERMRTLTVADVRLLAHR